MQINQLMIHSCVTEGYIAYAELFLESLRYIYGHEVAVKLDGLNLTQESIDCLKRIYGNVEIRNKEIDYNEISKKLDKNIDKKTIEKWKKEIEMGRATNKNFWYKLFISVDQRYRSLEEIKKQASNEGFTYLLHLDIDIYFRKPFIEKLLNIIQNYDIALYSNNKEHHTVKYLGAFICFNLNNNNVDLFINKWMAEIDYVPFERRWRGFGQSTLCFAIQNCTNLKVANLSLLKNSPIKSDKFDKDADLWQGSNSSKYKFTQTLYIIMNKFILPFTGANTLPILPFKAKLSRERCWKDFKRGFPRLEENSNFMIELLKKIVR